MIYLFNFQYNIYKYFATCFDSSESSSGIKFKNYRTYCFTVLSYSFAIAKGIPFLYYKSESMSIETDSDL